jgi:hypothetical protein
MTINWAQFKDQLKANEGFDLQFQYAENLRVAASYHITEIKQAPVTSVDCGGKMNSWTEVVVQLWEPDGEQPRPMKVRKALSIIELVENVMPLDAEAVVKIEFGNSAFDTRQLLPMTLFVEGEDLVVDLRPGTVQCKAIERGESCGTETDGKECCAPQAKPKIQLHTLGLAADTCSPGSGCC